MDKAAILGLAAVARSYDELDWDGTTEEFGARQAELAAGLAAWDRMYPDVWPAFESSYRAYDGVPRRAAFAAAEAFLEFAGLRDGDYGLRYDYAAGRAVAASPCVPGCPVAGTESGRLVFRIPDGEA